MTPASDLKAARVKVYAYGQSTLLALKGRVKMFIAYGPRIVDTQVYVAQGGPGMLLGCQTAEALGSVTFAFVVHQESVVDILHQFQEVFNSIVCL
ncbi:hypothetical protein NDU88_008960 [Pleurodeles waltl]|uniref:Uncharacterized protein n=1 Tax=Pleurodeles waltl TaxID=8319 RepID=A0AAV7RX89_PLEWA|nr:hypothetical protein NDU88_008960 [Pleurodeles waltl]